MTSRPVKTAAQLLSSASSPSTVQEAIETSRWIVGLENDWDDEGSPGVLETTWRRASDFLARQANVARKGLGKELPVPKILPGPNGSIDLHWKIPDFELIVNVPAEAAKGAIFYGDDDGNLCIKGSLNTSAEIL